MEPQNKITGIRLSELGNKIKEVLDNAFKNLNFWVIADISNHTYRVDKNYHFFQLVEKDESSNVIIAKVDGKAWGYGSAKIKEFENITGQKFSNGLQVLVNIKIVFSSAYGLQVELQAIDPNFTLGNIEKQRRETLLALLTNNPDVIQLVGEQYVTRNKGLKMKAVLQNIAVISSKDSAGLTDFLHTLRNNAFKYHFEIDIYHTNVQGDERANEMKNNIVKVFTSGVSYDILVILRGGGSDTDFLIFDNYQVALAIARFPIPVISGIGHQKNITIVDLMAHTSTKTPTKAAEFIIAHNRSFEDKLINLRNNIVIKSQQMISIQNQQLNHTYKGITEGSTRFLSKQKEMMVEFFQAITVQTKHLMFERKTSLQDMFRKITTRPIVITAQKRVQLDNQKNKILESSPIFLKHARGYLGHFVAIIEFARPEKILNMGFALIKQDGKYVTKKAKLKIGKDFDVIMNDGTIKAKS